MDCMARTRGCGRIGRARDGQAPAKSGSASASISCTCCVLLPAACAISSCRDAASGTGRRGDTGGADAGAVSPAGADFPAPGRRAPLATAGRWWLG